jgi:hypothetical protein
VERPRDPKLLAVSHFMINYPFANRLFPESLDAVGYAQQLGRAAILSDGDVVFQPRKIDRSGLYEIFEGRVLIYIHKELELDDAETKYPAAHYVMVDDKVRILAAIKKHWGGRVTTVFPRQGHYALDAALVAEYPKPDITLERIGELQKYSLKQILAAAGKRAPNRLLLPATRRPGRELPIPASDWSGWPRAIPGNEKAGDIPWWPTWETSSAPGNGRWWSPDGTGQSPGCLRQAVVGTRPVLR